MLQDSNLFKHYDFSEKIPESVILPTRKYFMKSFLSLVGSLCITSLILILMCSFWIHDVEVKKTILNNQKQILHNVSKIEELKKEIQELRKELNK